MPEERKTTPMHVGVSSGFKDAAKPQPGVSRPAGDQAAFRAAYDKWRAATNDYDQTLAEVMDGKREYDAAAMQAKIKEMARLLAAFDAAAVGIVTWRKI